MFEVRNKKTGETAVVYAVAGELLLVYDETSKFGWKWVWMYEYEPVIGRLTKEILT